MAGVLPANCTFGCILSNLLMEKRYKIWVLVAVTVATVGITFWLKRVGQDPAYHHFADGREWLGVRNFWNVIGNVFFVLVGVWGWVELRRRKVWPGGRVMYGVLFGAIVLTGLGSAYYHWEPDNDRLIWDRIPMTIVFMSLLAGVVGEWVDRKAGVWLLGPLVGLGVFSVLWWHHTEILGRGDLRLYGWVQFFPALAIVLILVMFGRTAGYKGVRSMVWVVVWYGVAKGLEHFDMGIYRALDISGHGLKHVASAVATGYLVGMFRQRYPREEMIKKGV